MVCVRLRVMSHTPACLARSVLAAAILATGLLSGCTADKDHSATGTVATSETSDVQPRMATYLCEDQTMLTVENRRSEVTLTDQSGDAVVLPASPAEQRSRYGGEGNALVLDGSDALWMRGNHEPLPCRR